MKKANPVSSRIVVITLLAMIAACQPEPSSDNARLAGLRVASVLGGHQEEGFARAEQPRQFVFPEDHGAHPDYRSEWWYLTVALQDEKGNAWGLQFTLFRQALSPTPTGSGPWHTGQAYLGHLAITDIATGRHLQAERLVRGHPGLAGVTTGNEFRAYIEDWSLEGSADGNLNLVLSGGEAGRFSVRLRVSQDGPLILQGNRGWSEKGPGNASYYYSIPRMSVNGSLTTGDETVEVQGLGWLDREWSTSVLGDNLTGWDWFSLQLNDRRSIMAFRLRRRDGQRDPYDHGLIADHSRLGSAPVVGDGDPGITLLKADDFTLTPVRFYRDADGIRWPVGWRLAIGDEQYSVSALLDDQRMDLSIVYWEGLVEVLDTSGNQAGLGYMELTGYSTEAANKN